MPEYLAPGVYVEEVDTGNKPIEGVSTSTVGFIGLAQRGPTAPTFLGSFSEYAQTFGSYVFGVYLPNAVEGFFLNGGKRCFVVRVVGTGATAASASGGALGGMTVNAAGPGTWAAGRLGIVVGTPGMSNPKAPAGPTLFKLNIFYWDPTVNEPTGGFLDPTVPANFTNPDYRPPTIAESYDNLSTDPKSSNYYVSEVNSVSNLVSLSASSTAAPTVPGTMVLLSGGSDGAALQYTDFTGDAAADPGTKRALAALEEIDEISILSCPDAYNLGPTDGANILQAMVDQCNNLKYRFAIVDAPANVTGGISNHYPFPVSNYAAYYYPWLTILDPITQDSINIPPSGHVAGIYAQTDNDRNVAKAPANVVIAGLYLDPSNPSAGLQLQITKAQQEILNPRGVNCLRYFPGRGNLVWGARTTSSDPDWKYVNVRRLFIYVEKSIDEGTQWVVFEPNYEPTWAKVRRSVSDFLTRVWMDGMLQGTTKEQAFFVRCDRTTMTQADIDNGRLIVLVGIAPVEPAEFVIFRIGQWTGGTDVSEG